MPESIEVTAIIIQLEALGLIEVTDDQTELCLTDKGEKRAKETLEKLPLDERLLLMMLCGNLASENKV